MKITILGGAGARVPLLTNGILQFDTDLRATELALWDIDGPRRETIAGISAAMAERQGKELAITTPNNLEDALTGSDFVISSIRVGGMASRIQDETIAIKHGTLGQETVGAGGFALALRTVPVMIEYLRKVALLAPHAWVLNFTNPVGIMSQAFLKEGVGGRTIGICDTPREQFEMLAHGLEVPLEDAFFDYLGLNHLGWVRGIQVRGEDRTKDLLDAPDLVSRAYRLPFFEKGFLRDLQMFPTEYLYYYYSPDAAREKTSKAGRTRGQLIVDLERQLMDSVATYKGKSREVLEAYDHYLASRNATYMSVETGVEANAQRLEEARAHLYSSAAGYDRIAIDVMRAIRNNRTTVMPVDVANFGAIDDFADSDAIEALCAIDSNGAHPLSSGHLPDAIKDLALQVKEYERLTVEAALSCSASRAEEALFSNPIITSREQARKILEEYRAIHRPHLDYLT